MVIDKSKLGFKQITKENWLLPDSVSKSFGKLSDSGQPVHMTAEDWINDIYEVGLSDSVPIEVVKLFEVARGSLVYGYLFYPLYGLAGDQLYRVLDAATYYRCLIFKKISKRLSFEKKLDLLYDIGIISETRRESWKAVRFLRNYFSHPTNTSIRPQSMTIKHVPMVAELISELFQE